MLLVIDVGNTNTVLGLYDGEELVHDWRIRTVIDHTVDEYGMLILNLYKNSRISSKAIKDIIISCVVPPMLNILEPLCQKYFGIEPLIVGPGVKTGMPIFYDNPKEVGADRIVNAVAAYEKYKTSLVVIDFGTATTFDVISEKGEYLGGAICPGIYIASDALFREASKLPRVEIFTRPETVIGKDTIGSIQSGIIYGYAGLVDGMVAKIKKEMGGNPRVIATGGLAHLMFKVSEVIEAVEPTLTLEGLKIISESL